MDKGQRKFESAFNLGDFPLETMKLPRVMLHFMKGAHHDIRKTFSNFYQHMVRPYHGTTPGVMFSKHVFHFCIVVNLVNDAFMVDYCHTFP